MVKFSWTQENISSPCLAACTYFLWLSKYHDSQHGVVKCGALVITATVLFPCGWLDRLLVL